MTTNAAAGDRTPQRSDTLRTRIRLLDAAEELLRSRRTNFTLPDLARESGISTATTYRHFEDVHVVFEEYYARTIDGLLAQLRAVTSNETGMARFENLCAEWIKAAAAWGRPITYIRRPEGYLERVRDKDATTSDIYGILGPVVEELIALGEVPTIDVDYAVLMWITIFDERVVIDLVESLEWEVDRVTRMLSSTLLGAWRGTAR
ncbi:hypothetical protein BH09ACT10_BH09ACT10_21550 [soil metagenome]